jgi:peptidoglycan/LPS O-acetylase OafA/YrhL
MLPPRFVVAIVGLGGLEMHFRIEDHSRHLQAARGIAALWVTVGHCFVTVVNGRIEEPSYQLSTGNAFLSIGEMFFQATAAVIFFYVLSGFVLGESLRRRPNFLAFLVRRLWRLLPVMWVSIGFAALVIALLPGGPLFGATKWLNIQNERTNSLADIGSDFAGLSWHTNRVLWSVQVELGMILLLPMLLFVSRRLPPLANIGVFVLLILLSLQWWGELPDWAMALRFWYCFYAGLILPQLLRDRIIARILASQAVTLGAFLVPLITFYLFLTGQLGLQYKFIGDAVVSLQLLGYIVSRPHAAKWLAARPLVWLGDISYSFYAYSLSVQIIISSWLLTLFSAPPSHGMATALTLFITLSTTAVALAIAAVSYRWIELPGMKSGQRLSALASMHGAIVQAYAVATIVDLLGARRDPSSAHARAPRAIPDI